MFGATCSPSEGRGRSSVARKDEFHFAGVSYDKNQDMSFLALLDASKQGYAAVDCGATSSVGGLGCVENLSDLAARHYYKDTKVDTDRKVNYRFGNASTQKCVSSAHC